MSIMMSRSIENLRVQHHSEIEPGDQPIANLGSVPLSPQKLAKMPARINMSQLSNISSKLLQGFGEKSVVSVPIAESGVVEFKGSVLNVGGVALTDASSSAGENDSETSFESTGDSLSEEKAERLKEKRRGSPVDSVLMQNVTSTITGVDMFSGSPGKLNLSRLNLNNDSGMMSPLKDNGMQGMRISFADMQTDPQQRRKPFFPRSASKGKDIDSMKRQNEAKYVKPNSDRTRANDKKIDRFFKRSSYETDRTLKRKFEVPEKKTDKKSYEKKNSVRGPRSKSQGKHRARLKSGDQVSELKHSGEDKDKRQKSIKRRRRLKKRPHSPRSDLSDSDTSRDKKVKKVHINPKSDDEERKRRSDDGFQKKQRKRKSDTRKKKERIYKHSAAIPSDSELSSSNIVQLAGSSEVENISFLSGLDTALSSEMSLSSFSRSNLAPENPTARVIKMIPPKVKTSAPTSESSTTLFEDSKSMLKKMGELKDISLPSFYKKSRTNKTSQSSFNGSINLLPYSLQIEELCHYCSLPILSRYYQIINGLKYHNEHIFCTICGQTYKENFRLEDGKTFCNTC